MTGSKNIGGRRYQWVAVVLTYAAVSLSAIPIVIAQIVAQKKEAAIHQTGPAQPNAAHANVVAPTIAQPSAVPLQPSAASSSIPAPAAPAPAAHKKPPSGLGKALGMLLVLGLASPFLQFGDNLAGGAIGLFILVLGVRIAWRIAKGLPQPSIEGPDLGKGAAGQAVQCMNLMLGLPERLD